MHQQQQQQQQQDFQMQQQRFGAAGMEQQQSDMNLQQFQNQQQLSAALEALRQQQDAANGLSQQTQQQALAFASNIANGANPEAQLANQEGALEQFRQQQEAEEQQMFQDQQQLVMQMLQEDPNITEEQLVQAIQAHYMQNNPNWNEMQDEGLEGNPSNLQLPPAGPGFESPTPPLLDIKNLEELARQYSISKEELEGMMAGAAAGGDMEQLKQQMIVGEFGAGELAEQQELNREANEGWQQQSKDEDELSSINTEQQRAYEKKRDQNFARELRSFYKKMIETLPKDAIEQMSKQSEDICKQIDNAQRAHIERRKLQKDQEKQRRAHEEKKFDNNNSAELQLEGDSSSIINSIVGADNDADSAFHSQLYGPNSNIDPDALIQNVLSQLQGHDELSKQFKRFLPEDDEDDKKSIERKYWQFRDQLQILEAQNEKEINSQNLTPEQQQFLQEQSLNLLVDMEALDCSGLLYNENGEVNSMFISQLKNDAFQMLFDLLRKYQTAKDSRCVQDALTMYGQKIMCVAEKYQQFLQIELQQPLEQQVNSGANPDEMDQQALIKYQVEKLGMNMKLVLSLIPQEVIDNYHILSPGLSQKVDDAENQDKDQQAQQNQQSSRRTHNENNFNTPREVDKEAKGADAAKAAKQLKLQTDRQSRLQRRQEAKEIEKDPKEKTSKYTKLQSKQTQNLKQGDKSKQSVLNSKGKKLSKKAQKELEKDKKRKGKSGRGTQKEQSDEASDSKAQEDNDEVTSEEASAEAEEEAEEEIEEEQEEAEEEQEVESDENQKNKFESPRCWASKQFININKKFKSECEEEDKKAAKAKSKSKNRGGEEDTADMAAGRKKSAMEEVIEVAQSEIQEEEDVDEDEEMEMNQVAGKGTGGRGPYMKSIVTEIQSKYPHDFGDLAKPELQIFMNLQKQLKSDSDWNTFIKIFCLYLDGVINLKTFFELLDERFKDKIKPDLRKELQELIPTRLHQRRIQSDILRPWNDLENQKFEKIHGSSYFKIGPYFRLPICSAKLDPKNQDNYSAFLNERYLSLSMGSENFKCRIRNLNEDLIFKNEDDMYKIDTQIDIFQKCHDIIVKEIKIYEELNDQQKKQYKLEIKKLYPLIFYWEKKYKDAFELFLKTVNSSNYGEEQDPVEYLGRLKGGFMGKIIELLQQKQDSSQLFEEVFKKHFIKSLDHRNVQYKEFIRKYLNKQDQMKEIKQVSIYIQSSQSRTWNQIKGGNCLASQFYHSFGTFVKKDLDKFDPKSSAALNDYPIDMNFVDKIASRVGKFNIQNQDENSNSLQTTLVEKMPHARMIFKEKAARNIAIKILCLYIKFSQQLNSNDRPRMTQILKQIIQNYLKVSEFKELYDQCCSTKTPYGIESLSTSQIDLMMSQDCLLYYVRRCERLIRERMNPENCSEHDEILDNDDKLVNEQDKNQKTQNDESDEEGDEKSQQDGTDQQDSFDPRNFKVFNERVLRDKSDPVKQKNRFNGFSNANQINQFKYLDELEQLKKQVYSSDLRKEQDPNQFQNVQPIKIQIQKTVEEIRQDLAEHSKLLVKATSSMQDQKVIETEPKGDSGNQALKKLSSPLKNSNTQNSQPNSEDEAADDKSEGQESGNTRENFDTTSPQKKKQMSGISKALNDREYDNDNSLDVEMKGDDDVQSPIKGNVSPEKQNMFSKKYPQKYKKLRIDHQNQYLELDKKNDSSESMRMEIDDALFLPFYSNKAAEEENYQLLYAPSNVFIFLKLFYTLYERILIAQTMVREKINQDLAEMSVDDKIKYGLCPEDSLEGKVDLDLLNDVFYKERYEYLLKGIFATTTQVSNTQNNSNSFGGLGSLTHNHSNLLDHNKYEDFGRALLGKNAFLLFQIDKIISQAVKQLQLMHNDQAYQKANSLFKSMNRTPSQGIRNGGIDTYDPNQYHQLNDRVYLANYVEQIVDLFSLKDNQIYQQGRNHKTYNQHQDMGEGHCKHSLSKFINQSNGILNDALKTDKDSTNITNNNASAAANSNFQVFRFLWSTKSQILTIHFFQLNPYLLPVQSTSQKNFKRIMQENFDLLHEIILQPSPSPFLTNCQCHKNYNCIVDPQDSQLRPGMPVRAGALRTVHQLQTAPQDPQNSSQHRENNPSSLDRPLNDPENEQGQKVTDYSKRLNPPIFLKRSMKVMRKVREKQYFGQGTDKDAAVIDQVQVNGLVHRIIPHVNQLTFDKQGEDVLVTRRKSKLKVSEVHKMQIRKQVKAMQIRSKRLKQIE